MGQDSTINESTSLSDQEALAATLLDPSIYEPPVDQVDCLETHISHVFLAGCYAQLKKAVDLGFLDFRTLASRRQAQMNTFRLEFPIAVLCRVLEVCRSSFYAWRKRPPSVRQQEDEILKVAIHAAHTRTRESYGSRRLQVELAAEGFVAGRDRIARLRHEMNIRCKQKRKFRATTESNLGF